MTLEPRHSFLQSLLFCALAGGISSCGEVDPVAVPGPGHDSTTAPIIAAENQRAGAPDFFQYTPIRNETTAGAFLDRRSVFPGDSVRIYGVSRDSQLVLQVYRMGWYGGAGARLVLDLGAVSTPGPTACAPPVPGPVECEWPPVATFGLPVDAKPGVYAVRYRNRDGAGGVVPLIVRAQYPTAIVVVLSLNTYQAYNTWGGSSFYRERAVARVPRVSFARPYDSRVIDMNFLGLDLPLVRFLERWGYPVSYAADADLDADAELGAGSRLIIVSGHSEYWTAAMRAHAEQLLGARTGLAFFGANDIFWRVRYESDQLGRAVLVCYKDHNDPPIYSWLGQFRRDRLNYSRTGQFRDLPDAEPENALIGIMCSCNTNYPPVQLIVRDTSPAWFRGTGYRVGDLTAPIGGWEGDHIFDNGHTPPGIRVLFEARYPSLERVTVTMQTTFYVARSGAGVFAAGTIGWNWGLDDRGVHPADPRQQGLVRNLLDWYLR